MNNSFGRIISSSSRTVLGNHQFPFHYGKGKCLIKCSIAGVLYYVSLSLRIDEDNGVDGSILENVYSRCLVTFNSGKSLFPNLTVCSRVDHCFRLSTTSCDAVTNVRPKRDPVVPLGATRIQRILHKLRIQNLPIPRTLTFSDPIFSYPELLRGLKQRSKDEDALRALQVEAIEARQSGDQDKIQQVFQKISSIAFGVGITPQQRESFLAKYGCTGWNIENLNYIVDLAFDRGIIEIGAGNGQWARAIRDHYEYTLKAGDSIKKVLTRRFGKESEFIIPYDDYSSLPLSPKIYHQYTKPAHDYFHPNVRRSTSHVDDVRRMTNRGRVLLLVYPPPGPMALETVKAYVGIYPSGNDTVIYCGEGLGGANANDDFFEYFLNCENTNAKDSDDKECKYRWCVLKVMDVLPAHGGKGYEKMFILRRFRVENRSE